MQLGKSDALLQVAKILITIGMIVLVLAAIIFIILLTAFFLRPELLAVTGAPPTQFLWMFGPLIVILFALGFQFLRTLRRIVVSVEIGNPFTTANADRLRVMAWLALAIQAVSIIATMLSTYTGGKESEIDATMSAFTGILVALVLFILARVFRVGAEMREELEGTV